MNFGLLFPAFLLIGALSALVLWLHAQRKRQVIVPSLRLWHALAIPSGAARRSRQWPPLTWPLVLQVLAVLFAALALAQPFIGARPADHSILIIDSPLPEDTTALAAALTHEFAQARAVSVLAGGSAPRLIAARQNSGTLEAEDLINRARAAMRAAPSPQTDWRAIETRRQMIDPDGTAALVVLGDTPLPADQTARHVILSDVPPTQMSYTLTPAAQPYSFRLSGQIAMAEGVESARLVLGYADGPGVTPLPWVEKTLGRSVSGRINVMETLNLPGPGLLTVILDGRLLGTFQTEAPAAENAYLYFGEGQQPWLNALRALPDTALYQSSAVPADLSTYRAAIVDGVAIDRAPALPTLWIGAAHLAGQDAPARLAQSDPDAWQTDNPVLAGIDLKPLLPGPAYQLPVIAGADVLLSAAGQPLIQLAEIDGIRQAWLAFDPRSSNWQNDPALALLTASVMGWLAPADPLLACTAAQPCYPDGRPLGQIVADQAARNDIATTGVNLRLWLLLAATACIIADTVLAARRRGGRFGLPSVPATLASVIMLAAALNMPVPQPSAAAGLVAIDVQGASTQSGLRLDQQSMTTASSLPQISAAGPETAATGVQQAALAIELANASLPSTQAGAILLGAPIATSPITDPALTSRLPIHYIAPAPPSGAPVLRSLELTGRPMQGEPLPVTLLVHAPAATDATLRLTLDGEMLSEVPVALHSGDNRIETLLPELESPEAFLQAELLTTGAVLPTQTAGLIIRPGPQRPVAVIAADRAEGEAVVQLLLDQGMVDITLLNPAQTPTYLRDWAPYGSVVLVDTPALEIEPYAQRMLQRMVNEYGLGLLIMGGPQSFGPGGYFETPLEELSPLSARVPREAPEVTMVFVLDRSGSMQQAVGDSNRLGVAKNATLSALELLNPQSQIGVIVFDTEETTVVPLSTLDIPAAQIALDRVDTGGGTAIYPGLVAAYRELQRSESPAKHIIVMTDGLSQPGDWEGILGQITADGTTVSAVAIGVGADTGAAENIARLGNGVAHISRDFEALPSILAQEAMMFSNPLNEEPSQPVWTGVTAPFLRAMPASLPPINAFVLTTAKPEATLAMTAPDAQGEDMPLLAWWRVGNGQVMAFASDVTSDWTAPWHDLPGYGALWADSLRAFQPVTPTSGLILTLAPDHESLAVTLTALSREGEQVLGLRPVAEVRTSQGTDLVNLHSVGGGVYRGTLARGLTGRYDATLTADSIAAIPLGAGEGTPAAPSASWYEAFAPAADDTRSIAGTLALAAMTGGAETTLAALQADLSGTQWQFAGAVPLLALIALALFLLDLIRRYADIRILRRRGSQSRPAPEGARP
ncbi:VWA domain-containing protein [Ketogulonicigenium vulgare]|uniref:VWA domain-containing protein n=1 Tax=Ketogulonicigenium vulgare TaxID=92945 RepID=UPI002358F008|nr:VWA domain-containing protein [Ketogulonicigenium vulgare]